MLRIILTLVGFVFFQNLSSQSQSLNVNPSWHSDTIAEKQDLYNGIRWSNRYRNYENDQFLFTSMFLNGNITVISRTFKNIKLKYDIYSDEIITPVNLQDIIQINKEMVDSFSVFFENRQYKFINLKKDSVQNLTGYVQVLYDGPTSLVIVHKKIFTPASDPTKDGTFIYSKMAYIKDGSTYLPFKSRTFYGMMGQVDKLKVKEFIRRLKPKVTRKNPENIVPVLKYYDDLRKTDEE